MEIQQGDCVKIPDGRIGRVREILNGTYKIRVRRKKVRLTSFFCFLMKNWKLLLVQKDV